MGHDLITSHTVISLFSKITGESTTQQVQQQHQVATGFSTQNLFFYSI